MPDLMPSPWFKASSSPFSIEYGLGEAPKPHRLADLSKGERQLGYFVLPSFQRPAVWTQAQKLAFMESLWDGLPTGSYVFNSDEDYENGQPLSFLLDGQQRWTAILDYVADRFPVKGYRFGELGVGERRRFLNREFTMNRCNLSTEAECREVYAKLAYGGTPHLKADGEYLIDGQYYHLVPTEPEPSATYIR